MNNTTAEKLLIIVVVEAQFFNTIVEATQLGIF